MRAFVHFSVIEAVFYALLKNGNLFAPIATFVSNHFKKETNRIRRKEDLARSERMIRDVLPSLQTSVSSVMTTFHPKKKIDAYVVVRRTRISQDHLQALSKTTVGVWSQVATPRSLMIRRAFQAQRKERRTKLLVSKFCDQCRGCSQKHLTTIGTIRKIGPGGMTQIGRPSRHWRDLNFFIFEVDLCCLWQYQKSRRSSRLAYLLSRE